MLPQTACTAIRYTLQRIARENKSAARATADLANIVPYTETSPASIAAACVHFESSIDHTVDLIRFRRSDMGAALSHSLRHSRCAPLVTLERKHLRVSTRLVLLIAAFRPGCSAFRRPVQVQQCARLMSICGQQPQESSKCVFASMHASTYYQHPFCTGVLSCLLS